MAFEIKVALSFALVVALVLGGWKLRSHIDKGGYDRCQTEHKLANAAAADSARENVVNVEKKYAPKLKEIREAPDSGIAVGPLTTRAIDGL